MPMWNHFQVWKPRGTHQFSCIGSACRRISFKDCHRFWEHSFFDQQYNDASASGQDRLSPAETVKPRFRNAVPLQLTSKGLFLVDLNDMIQAAYSVSPASSKVSAKTDTPLLPTLRSRIDIRMRQPSNRSRPIMSTLAIQISPIRCQVKSSIYMWYYRK